MSAGKGDKRRPSGVPEQKYRDEYDRIFYKRAKDDKVVEKIK